MPSRLSSQQAHRGGYDAAGDFPWTERIGTYCSMWRGRSTAFPKTPRLNEGLTPPFLQTRTAVSCLKKFSWLKQYSNCGNLCVRSFQMARDKCIQIVPNLQIWGHSYSVLIAVPHTRVIRKHRDVMWCDNVRSRAYWHCWQPATQIYILCDAKKANLVLFPTVSQIIERFSLVLESAQLYQAGQTTDRTECRERRIQGGSGRITDGRKTPP